jgi:hypothetical protein
MVPLDMFFILFLLAQENRRRSDSGTPLDEQVEDWIFL